MSDDPSKTQQLNANSPESGEKVYVQPIVAPCRVVPYSAPFGWLKKGWSDLQQVPKISLWLIKPTQLCWPLP